MAGPMDCLRRRLGSSPIYSSFRPQGLPQQNWRRELRMESSLGNPLFLHHLHPHPRAPRLVHPSLFPVTINASMRGASSFHRSTCAKPACFRLRVQYDGVGHVWGYSGRTTNTSHQVARVTLSGVEDTEVSSSQFEDFDVVSTSINEDRELKIGIEVSGGKTEAIYNQVFDRMVRAAQPIPGFRREKGGKTPNVPKHILLEILGPSRVYKEVIKRIIDSTVAEYIEKKQLKVSQNLKVEQSFEDLEATFEPGEVLGFDAVLKLLD